MLNKISDRALDRAAGKAEVGGDGLYFWPTCAVAVSPIPEAHIYSLRPVRKFLCIDVFKATHMSTPYVRI